VTFAPPTISALAAYWVAQGGVNSGIVGDLAHQQRASYHNGQDVITKYGRTAVNDYTIRLARDREPYLTNAAAALDLGRLDGTLANLQAFSRWLVARCKADPTGYRLIRDVIYSPDGKVVRRWDNESKTLNVGGDGTGQGDNSHLWHTHISFYRDSEPRAKVQLFRPYFEEAIMPLVTKDPITPLVPKVIGWVPGAILYDLNAKVFSTTTNTVAGRPSPYSVLVGGVTYRLVLTGDDPANDPTLAQIVMVKKGNPTGDDPKVTIGDPPAPTVPATDCTDEVKAAVASYQTRIQGIKAKVAANAADVAND
jgi:hypothetical protein